MLKGIVTDIQRYSLHDGPGIRTTVFLKGCNMKCGWCHNPENINKNLQLEFFEKKCINCGDCFQICNYNVHKSINGQHIIEYDRCRKCGKCVKFCYSEALIMVGKKITVKEIYNEIKQDIPYYQDSGGGVTISGGEVFFQKDFSYKLLSYCKSQGIHTAVETNLSGEWDIIKTVLPVIDLVIFDIKFINNELHKKWTGISNKNILENAKKISQMNKDIIIRTPVIPEVNENEIKKIADFIKDFENLICYELLPYNPLGEDKYKRLGMKCVTGGTRPLDDKKMEELAEIARKIKVTTLVK